MKIFRNSSMDDLCDRVCKLESDLSEMRKQVDMGMYFVDPVSVLSFGYVKHRPSVADHIHAICEHLGIEVYETRREARVRKVGGKDKK